MRMRRFWGVPGMWLWKWILLYMLLVASSVAKKQKLEIITEVRRVKYVRRFQYEFIIQTVFRISFEIQKTDYYTSICLDIIGLNKEFISNRCIRVWSLSQLGLQLV